MLSSNLPIRGETSIGKLLYDLQLQILIVNPQSIQQETGSGFQINQELFDELWTDFSKKRLATIQEELLNNAIAFSEQYGLVPDGYPFHSFDEMKPHLIKSVSDGLTLSYYDVLSYIWGNVAGPQRIMFSGFKTAFLSAYPHYDFPSAEKLLTNVSTEPVNRAGKFPKRVAKFLYEVYRIKITAGELSVIGNIYNMCRLSSKEFYVAVTNNFNWYDGEFGKEDSCWWGCFTNSRDTLHHYGGYGLLFYNTPKVDLRNDSNREGCGRFWLLPVSDTLMIGFNPYGITGKDAAAVAAKLLEKLTGKLWVYGKREFYNTSGEDAYPYINGDNLHNNSGGSKVFAIYCVDSERRPDNKIEMCLERQNGYFSKGQKCYECEDVFDDDDLTEVNGRLYCENCLCNNFTQCERCGDWVSDSYSFEDREGYYCESCHNYHLEGSCEDCGCDFSYSDSLITLGDSSYCERCSHRHEEEENEQ